MKSEPLGHIALLFLAVNLTLALLLHMERLPVWIIGAAIAVLVWRYFIYLGRVASPHWVVKGLLVASGFTGIYLTYGWQPSIEAMVSLLVAGLVLKPLEVEATNESYLLIFLSYLLIALNFLFDQSPLGYIWVMAILVLTLATQVAVNLGGEKPEENHIISQSPGKIVGQAFLIFLKSIPLALFLFFILPRLDPLWSMNISTQAGTIGLSNSMSPGDVAELGKSDELAFRVRFLEGKPDVKQLYWRALVLDYFDGEQWSQKYKPEIDWPPFDGDSSENAQANVSYEIILQPHDENWLYALGVSKPITTGIGVSEDGRLVSKKKIHSQTLYKANAQLNQTMGKAGLTKKASRYYLQLPASGNLKSRQFAQDLKSTHKGSLDFARALKRYISENEFYYTLSPGALNSDSTIDEFLFETQKGFCAHFAGSVVYLMRSVGIPARVVLGYQGAEENPVAGYYSVYQYNAHAWVEIWVEGLGWLRIDPTAWISPERIEQGVESALKNEFVGFSSGSSWLGSIRNQMNALNYYWNDWMLSYKGDAQQKFISELFGDRDQAQMIGIYVACFFALIGAVFLTLLFDFKRVRLSDGQRLIKRYRLGLESKGYELKDVMSIKQISQLALTASPHLAKDINWIREQIEVCLYVDPDSRFSKVDYRKITASIKKLSRQISKAQHA
ncbi:MAG: DUF3488 and transglutaminase-like domain-containing protein [Bermanella sp.]